MAMLDPGVTEFSCGLQATWHAHRFAFGHSDEGLSHVLYRLEMSHSTTWLHLSFHDRGFCRTTIGSSVAILAPLTASNQL